MELWAIKTPAGLGQGVPAPSTQGGKTSVLRRAGPRWLAHPEGAFKVGR